MSMRPTRATPSASEPAGFEVRRAVAADLDEVGRLTAEVYVGEGYIDPADAYVGELSDGTGRAARSELWVAADEHGLLGSVAFCPMDSHLREVGRDGEGEFRMLAVAGRARNRGVGRALVEACLARSRELGYHAVRICSLEQMTDAHRLYARLGFTRAPEDDWSPLPGVDLIAFVLELSPPPGLSPGRSPGPGTARRPRPPG